MNRENLTTMFKPEHREAGFYLEDDEDFLYPRQGGKQIAVWSSTRVTIPAVLEEIDRILRTREI